MKRFALLALFVTSSLFITSNIVNAQNYNDGVYGSCQYGSCSISLATSTTVSLPITPSPAGACTTASDTVSVSTSSSTGYSLYLSDADNETALVKSGPDKLMASSGTRSTPVAMTANTWGYRIDSDNFGAGPTSAVNSQPISPALYAGIQPSTNPVVLISPNTLQPAPSNTSVWYSACADSSSAAGNYSGVVQYTAVVN